MLKKDLLLRRTLKYTLIALAAPILLTLLSAYFSRYVLRADYDKDQVVYKIEIVRNAQRYEYIKENLDELKVSVNLLLEKRLKHLSTPPITK